MLNSSHIYGVKMSLKLWKYLSIIRHLRMEHTSQRHMTYINQSRYVGYRDRQQATKKIFVSSLLSMCDHGGINGVNFSTERSALPYATARFDVWLGMEFPLHERLHSLMETGIHLTHSSILNFPIHSVQSSLLKALTILNTIRQIIAKSVARMCPSAVNNYRWLIC